MISCSLHYFPGAGWISSRQAEKAVRNITSPNSWEIWDICKIQWWTPDHQVSVSDKFTWRFSSFWISVLVTSEYILCIFFFAIHTFEQEIILKLMCSGQLSFLSKNLALCARMSGIFEKYSTEHVLCKGMCYEVGWLFGQLFMANRVIVCLFCCLFVDKSARSDLLLLAFVSFSHRMDNVVRNG